MSAPAATSFRRLASDFGSRPAAVCGLVLLGAIVFVALAAPFVSPQNPGDLAHVQAMDNGLPPGSKAGAGVTYWLGTDDHGRDMLSAILHGLRLSLAIGAGATALAFAVGVATGLPAAYHDGRIGALFMRIVDLELAFPALLIAVIVMAILGQGTGKVIAALVVVQWAHYARTVHDAVRIEKRKAYVDAARGLALPASRILLRHLLPSCLPALLVAATGQMASAIVLEATLSFLGLGLPIAEPSLGLLIAGGYRDLLAGKYWISFFPGVALALALLGLNLLAEPLREPLNPVPQR